MGLFTAVYLHGVILQVNFALYAFVNKKCQF
jgi:hypothetical protein